MKPTRTHKPGSGRAGRGLEVLPVDPRDPDVVRAKALAVAHRDHAGGSPGRGGAP